MIITSLLQVRGEPMSKKCRLPIPIVNSRYLPTIGRLIGETDGHLDFFLLMYSRIKTCRKTGSDVLNTDPEFNSMLLRATN